MKPAKIIPMPEGTKKLQFHSDHQVEFICGASSLTLFPDGSIVLKGKSFAQLADHVVIKSKLLEIN